MTKLSGKVALITGGAGGIGLAIVKELLSNGAKGVAIVDISEPKDDKIFGSNKIIFIKTDIKVKKQLANAYETTIQTFNQLDIVINNAGVVNETAWQETVAVNFVAVVESTYLAMEKYLPKYKSGNEGVIVNTSSILGLQTIQTGPMYCATKHAVIGFSKALGGEEFYKKYEVRVLTICPGLVRTRMITPQEDTSNLLFPDLCRREVEALNPIVQEPERVGKALIDIIAKGKNGSVWVIEDDVPEYEVVIPDRKTMKVQQEALNNI